MQLKYVCDVMSKIGWRVEIWVFMIIAFLNCYVGLKISQKNQKQRNMSDLSILRRCK